MCLCAALYVQERVERVYRECVEDHFVEVPDVTYVEKIVEVPQEQIQEKIVQVIKPIKKELIRYVPKDMFVDQVMEYEEVKASSFFCFAWDAFSQGDASSSLH